MLKKLISAILFFLILSSCKTDTCENNSIEDFDHFLGLTRENTELELMSIMGKQLYGNYSSDSTAFIYQYLNTENAPVSIWVNSKSGNIETIFIEILGIDTFKDDIDLAIEAYKMDACDSRFFGMADTEIISVFGIPSSVNEDDTGIKYLTYSSLDSKILVEFRFYPEQNFRCSTISVNWFY